MIPITGVYITETFAGTPEKRKSTLDLLLKIVFALVILWGVAMIIIRWKLPSLDAIKDKFENVVSTVKDAIPSVTTTPKDTFEELITIGTNEENSTLDVIVQASESALDQAVNIILKPFPFLKW